MVTNPSSSPLVPNIKQSLFFASSTISLLLPPLPLPFFSILAHNVEHLEKMKNVPSLSELDFTNDIYRTLFHLI
ncbi:hypothetical protein C4D60_Mb01t27770 [Musa balbisiana]|uniref:Uncharacterized protein n=1 Tax=Musa balbisiana TaxID=52838 RepID=A0A4S8JR89_MUSBA|nr:hypothetical protein C4D60_Mb01t27770 [Musa balbisiana]